MEIIPYVGMKNRKFKKRLHNGMFLYTDPSEHIQQQIFWYGFYEKKFVLTWEHMIRNDWTVLDIGSNIGYYSLIAAGKACNGRVYAFEADSRNLKKMRENLELNQVKNIEIIPLAVSDENAEQVFYHSGPENMGMSSLNKPENISSQEIVRTITVDSWAREHNVEHIHCIKMDIEGAEFKALLGMKHVLQHFRPVLFMEITSELLARSGNTPTQIYQLLSSYGYVSYQVIQENELKRIDSVMEDDLVVFCAGEFCKNALNLTI